jgi:hypothetical protein
MWQLPVDVQELVLKQAVGARMQDVLRELDGSPSSLFTEVRRAIANKSLQFVLDEYQCIIDDYVWWTLLVVEGRHDRSRQVIVFDFHDDHPQPPDDPDGGHHIDPPAATAVPSVSSSGSRSTDHLATIPHPVQHTVHIQQVCIPWEGGVRARDAEDDRPDSGGATPVRDPE